MLDLSSLGDNGLLWSCLLCGGLLGGSLLCGSLLGRGLLGRNRLGIALALGIDLNTTLGTISLCIVVGLLNVLLGLDSLFALLGRNLLESLGCSLSLGLLGRCLVLLCV
jgi:hypothetical protein